MLRSLVTYFITTEDCEVYKLLSLHQGIHGVCKVFGAYVFFSAVPQRFSLSPPHSLSTALLPVSSLWKKLFHLASELTLCWLLRKEKMGHEWGKGMNGQQEAERKWTKSQKIIGGWRRIKSTVKNAAGEKYGFFFLKTKAKRQKVNTTQFGGR